MSTAISIRLPDALAREIDHIADETERSRSFHIQKALESYIEDFADVQIALDRLRDQTDPVVSSRELRKTLAVDITYKKSVGKDLAGLGKAGTRRILDKIEKELPARADAYPVLRGQFSGLRKLRVGDYRVIFAILGTQVLVLRIGHRREVYEQ